MKCFKNQEWQLAQAGYAKNAQWHKPPNRCAVAFSVSCEQWKSPALLHAKRELLSMSLWLQGHVMVFTSYQSLYPAQTVCFSALPYMWAFYGNIMTDSNTQVFNMVKDLWSITTEGGRMSCLPSPFILYFCSQKTSAFLRTDGILFGIHRVSDTNPSDSGIWRKHGTTMTEEVGKQLQKFCTLLQNGHHMGYPEFHKHALLPGNCKFSHCEC